MDFSSEVRVKRAKQLEVSPIAVVSNNLFRLANSRCILGGQNVRRGRGINQIMAAMVGSSELSGLARTPVGEGNGSFGPTEQKAQPEGTIRAQHCGPFLVLVLPCYGATPRRSTQSSHWLRVLAARFGTRRGWTRSGSLEIEAKTTDGWSSVEVVKTRRWIGVMLGMADGMLVLQMKEMVEGRGKLQRRPRDECLYREH